MLEDTRQAIRCLVREQIEAADAEGRTRYGSSRCITFKQEEAYRLCHHDFFGLDNTDAAEVMGTTPNLVSCLLHSIRVVAPQLFPILRPKTARVYRLFTENGFTVREIAIDTELSSKTVWEILWRLYRDRDTNNLYFRSGSSRRLSYCDWMDPHIREQW